MGKRRMWRSAPRQASEFPRHEILWLVVAFFGLLWAAFHVVNMLPFVLFGAMLFVFLVAAAYLEIKTQKEEGRRDAQVPDTGEQR